MTYLILITIYVEEREKVPTILYKSSSLYMERRGKSLILCHRGEGEKPIEKEKYSMGEGRGGSLL